MISLKGENNGFENKTLRKAINYIEDKSPEKFILNMAGTKLIFR